MQVAATSSSSTGHRRAQATLNAHQLHSAAWPDAASENKEQLARMEHAELQLAEMASALRSSQTSEMELQRRLDEVKAQLRRASATSI